MEKRFFEVSTLIVLILFFMVCSVFAFPNFINYQGQLTDSSGNPLNGDYSLTYMIYDTETEGEALWTEQHTITVTNGLYNAELGTVNTFPEDLFETEMLYLEVIIHNEDTGSDETLSPRIPFTSTGFSMKAKDAETVAWSNITGKPATFADDVMYVDSNGNVGIGTSTPNATFQIIGSMSRQGTTLNGTNKDTHINLGVNSFTEGNYPSVLGGSDNAASGWYSTVSGGGSNTASGDHSTVSGGIENTASGYRSTVSGGIDNTASGYGSVESGGVWNTASGTGSTVSGGGGNTANGLYSTVSGGFVNAASNDKSTVSGGDNNTASGQGSTVSGGGNNVSSGTWSTIPGGYSNIAAGDYSWAGGHNMQLTEDADRTFAWGYSDSNVSISVPDAFIIYSSNVGIGTTYPSRKMDVTGNVIANAYEQHSDARLKKNIAPIDNALDKVAALQGVEFEWRKEEYPEKALANGQKIGLIAQEVEEVLPEVVSTDNEGYKSVEYANMVGLLIESIKAQQLQIEELKSQNTKLKERVDAIEGHTY